MTNWNIKTKLLSSFIVMAVLSLFAGITANMSIQDMERRDQDLYEYIPAIYELAHAMEYFREIEIDLYRIAVYSSLNDDASIHDAINQINDNISHINEALDEYETTAWDEATEANFYNAKRVFSNEFIPFALSVQNTALEGGGITAIYNAITAGMGVSDRLSEALDAAIEDNIEWSYEEVTENKIIAARAAILQTIAMILSMGLAVFFGLYITKLIATPILVLSDFMKKAGDTGDINLRQEDVETIGRLSRTKDEIGQMIGNTALFVGHVTTISDELEQLAGGDLTTEIEVLSDRDVMGLSVKHLADNFNKMFDEIKTATAQVSAGSHQIADGAQSLAQGSTQQASTVQQLSANSSEIAEKTKANAVLASKAADLANTIKSNAEKGSRQMDEMMDAVNEINHASQSISQVIKVIDNIAFQTNILALNAAVEAARAGQHGKGFAVVADEVRNLAAKSADAAKDTGELISNSMEKAQQGASIATSTTESLKEIVSGINESSEIIMEIAKSSETQTMGIIQIHDGIDQVAQVIQQNSATAEESAAASEQLSGQADMLEQLMAQFKLRNSSTAGYMHSSANSQRTEQYTAPNTSAFSLSNDSGKY